MKRETFVIVSLSPWDFEYGSNIRDIAIELAKKHEVIFVNIPVKRTEIWKKSGTWIEHRKRVINSKVPKIENFNEHCKVLTLPIVIEPINRLRSKLAFNILNRINGKRYSNAIKRALKEQGVSDFVLINDNDFYSGFYLPEFLKPKKSVYYIRDYMRAMDYWKCHSDRMEPTVIKNYDIVLANSVYLSNYASEWNPNSYYVGQGCDVEFFLTKPDRLDLPLDLQGLQGKLIGYVGALNNERLDIDLIEFIASDNPDSSVVLIGPEDNGFVCSSLHNIPNIRFLGVKDLSEVNNYLYNFDVCFNPQKLNDITVGNYPRKIDEYLAVGKPVVATFTETMLPFESVTYLAKSKTEFSKMIKLAIHENNLEKEKERKTFASQHTWFNSVDSMLTYIFI